MKCSIFRYGNGILRVVLGRSVLGGPRERKNGGIPNDLIDGLKKKPRRGAAFFHKKETLLLEGAGTPNFPRGKCTFPVQPT